MKLALAAFLATTFFSLPALADFEIIQDGVRYTCTPSAINPGAGLDCANRAYQGPFSRDESNRLCQGARSNAPAECGIAAYQGPFSREEAITLCQGATVATGPVQCASRAYLGPFSRAQSLTLCQGGGTVANAECAIRAYAGPYSLEESVNICRNAGSLPVVNRLLDRIEGASIEGGIEATLKRANLKAFEKGDLSFEKIRQLRF